MVTVIFGIKSRWPMAMEEDAYNMLSDIIDKNNMNISSFVVNVQTPK